MAQYPYRANLSAASYPFSFDDSGRTVIMSKMDQNFNRQVQSREDEDKDIGIPQILYLQNALPTSRGYKAANVRWVQSTQVEDSPGSYIRQLVGLKDNNFVAVNTRSGLVKVSLTADVPSEPVFANGFSPVDVDKPVITTELSRYTFYFLRGGWSFAKFDISYRTVNTINNILTLAPNVQGRPSYTVINYIQAVGNRLCLFAADAEGHQIVVWSSGVDPLDFDITKGAITGAGYIEPNNLKSPIRFIVPHPLGAIVYTDNETIGMFLNASDALNPFTFREISGVNIGKTAAFIYGTSENSGHYLLTSYGSYRITQSTSEPVFPELDVHLRESEFITVDKNLTKSSRIRGQRFSLGVALDRYMCFCFTETVGTLGIIHVYDMLLKRWGQLCFRSQTGLPITGLWVFNRGFFTVMVYESSPGGNGHFQVYEIRLDSSLVFTDAYAPKPLAILGKYQLTRGQKVSIQQIEIENSYQAQVLQHYSLDGKTFTRQVVPFAVANGELYKAFSDVIGKSHIIAIEGQFDLNTLQLTFVPEGGNDDEN